MSNPGQPLNSSQVSGMQGTLPDGFTVQTQQILVGNGQQFNAIPASFNVPMDKAVYGGSRDVSLVPLRTDYKNP